MWNWLRKRISIIFEYVRIVGAVFSWYTLWKGNAMLSSIINREELYPVKDCALLMTWADDFFWTFEQAVSYYQFALVNYIGFKDRGMVLAGGCRDTNGRPQIDKTEHLQEAYEFGKCIYPA